MPASTLAPMNRRMGDPKLKGPLLLSVFFHGLLFSGLIVSTIFSHRGDFWGGPDAGGSISVKLVGVLPAIPLPEPEVTTNNRVVDDTKGLYKSEPPPKVQEPPPPDTTPIPEFSKEKPPQVVSKPSRLLDDKTPPAPPPDNAVPYGQGGAPAVPYSQATQAAPNAQATQFTMGAGMPAGMSFSSSGAGGDFSSRFGWYVTAVRSRVSSNWLQSTIDPSLHFAPRAVVDFDILRNGAVANVQILQSSGNASVDGSAVRAVVNSSPVAPLPPDYSGSKVSVEFWFDFKR